MKTLSCLILILATACSSRSSSRPDGAPESSDPRPTAASQAGASGDASGERRNQEPSPIAGAGGKNASGTEALGGAGTAEAGAAATSGSSAEAGSFATCPPAEERCSDRTVERCADDGSAWQAVQECPFVCARGDCTGSCKPGTEKCAEDHVESCNALGQWVTTTPCAFVCLDGVCTGECTPGAGKCDDKVPLVCTSMGRWVEAGPECEFVCSAGKCTGACKPEASQCNDGTVQTCTNTGSWRDTERCEFVCAGAGVCSGACLPDSKKCDGWTPQTCNAAGEWRSGSACPFLCKKGACTGECKSGVKRCHGGGTQTCGPEAFWGTDEACPTARNADATCADDGVCGFTCTPGFDDCNREARDGCEADLANPATCGSCNQSCPSEHGQPTCSKGRCGIDCSAGYADCTSAAGCETALGSAKNCLSCGNSCADAPNADPICTSKGCDLECAPLWGNCDGKPENGCEHSLSDDTKNCGRCGKSCYGGACVHGVCSEPSMEVVADLGCPSTACDVPLQMVLDDSNVYWTSFGGHVEKLAKAGGTALTLRSGPRPFAIAEAAGTIFWSDTVQNTIRKVPVGGGEPSELVRDHGPFWLATDGTHLYWNDQGISKCNCADKITKIYRAPIFGGKVELFDTLMFETSRHIAVDSEYVYIAGHGTFIDNQYKSGLVVRIAKADKSRKFLSQGILRNGSPRAFRNGLGPLVVTGTDVIFVAEPDASSPSVLRVPKVGGETVVVAALDNAAMPTALASDGVSAYIVNNYAVKRVRLTGGEFDILARGQISVLSVQVDATHVYWTVGGFDGDHDGELRASDSDDTLTAAVMRAIK